MIPVSSLSMAASFAPVVSCRFFFPFSFQAVSQKFSQHTWVVFLFFFRSEHSLSRCQKQMSDTGHFLKADISGQSEKSTTRLFFSSECVGVNQRQLLSFAWRFVKAKHISGQDKHSFKHRTNTSTCQLDCKIFLFFHGAFV